MTSALPSQIGRYRIVSRLGAGGMGVVYLAEDPLLRRTAAIKVLPGEGDADMRERFLREARAVAALRHPNIVTIYDIGEEAGRLFIAMERIEGESMADAIARRADYAVERKVQLLIDLCAGLGHAHRHGIIHRDIKPGNLMIDAGSALKVLDFGLARLAAGGSQIGLTQSGALVGTPNYMSPEQVRGDPLDQRSDIFSVGLVMYEWLSYRRAFASESIHTLLHDIVFTEPAPLRDHMPSIDPGLAAAVDKALVKDPERRYATLESLATDLQRVLGRMRNPDAETTVIVDLPETASIETPLPGPIPAPSRRRPGAAAIGAAGAVLIAVMTVTYLLNRTAPSPADLASRPTGPSASAPTTEPPAPQPGPASVAMAPESQPVTINVLPWARVRIVAVGHDAKVPEDALLTPFTVSLEPGDYRLECENDGVSPRTVLPITVSVGQPLVVTRRMQGFNPAQLVETLTGARP